MTNPLVIALDGPAGAGKTAVGRRLAARLGLAFIDSGLFYRAVASLVMETGASSMEEESVMGVIEGAAISVHDGRAWSGERDLSDLVHLVEINQVLPRIAAMAPVRDQVNRWQHRSISGPGAVVAGRDIGTVVFPSAAFKFYLTASVEERARRRAEQFARAGQPFDAEVLRREIADRDATDSARAVAPMRPAADAQIIETDHLGIEAVVDRLARVVQGE